MTVSSCRSPRRSCGFLEKFFLTHTPSTVETDSGEDEKAASTWKVPIPVVGIKFKEKKKEKRTIIIFENLISVLPSLIYKIFNSHDEYEISQNDFALRPDDRKFQSLIERKLRIYVTLGFPGSPKEAFTLGQNGQLWNVTAKANALKNLCFWTFIGFPSFIRSSHSTITIRVVFWIEKRNISKDRVCANKSAWMFFDL